MTEVCGGDRGPRRGQRSAEGTEGCIRDRGPYRGQRAIEGQRAEKGTERRRGNGGL